MTQTGVSSIPSEPQMFKQTFSVFLSVCTFIIDISLRMVQKYIEVCCSTAFTHGVLKIKESRDSGK